MEHIYTISALWLGLAVLSAIISYHLKLSIALVEICVGVLAGTIANKYFGQDSLGSNQEWLKFLAASGAVFLTFLAGAELDHKVMKTKLKEVLLVGFVGFLAPFAGGAVFSYYLLHWGPQASLLAGVALSTTSMAVVYAVMIETGLNATEFGKGLLGACFVNDLWTVIVLGLIFSPFTYKTAVFITAAALIISVFPYITGHLTEAYGNRTAAIRVKWVSFVLFALAALSVWADSEAVLPAYVAGMALAEFASDNQLWVKRLRSLTVGFLTPFYFIRAGSFVSIPALVSAPMVVIILLISKVSTKIFGLYPVISLFRKEKSERWYYTLLMSTGLTFGSISALYGYSHGIIDARQYSFLIITVIASAVIPTAIANFKFLPRHLLAHVKQNAQKAETAQDE